MRSVERLQVLLASPGDVSKERGYVEQVVEEVNRTVASGRGVVLQVIRWERDAFHGYGSDAQALVNDQIAEMQEYDLFVGMYLLTLSIPSGPRRRDAGSGRDG
jgi:hypothetical protein